MNPNILTNFIKTKKHYPYNKLERMLIISSVVYPNEFNEILQIENIMPPMIKNKQELRLFVKREIKTLNQRDYILLRKIKKANKNKYGNEYVF